MEVPIVSQSAFPVFMSSVIFIDMSYLAKFVPPGSQRRVLGDGQGGWGGGGGCFEVLWRPEIFAVNLGGERFF